MATPAGVIHFIFQSGTACLRNHAGRNARLCPPEWRRRHRARPERTIPNAAGGSGSTARPHPTIILSPRHESMSTPIRWFPKAPCWNSRPKQPRSKWRVLHVVILGAVPRLQRGEAGRTEHRRHAVPACSDGQDDTLPVDPSRCLECQRCPVDRAPVPSFQCEFPSIAPVVPSPMDTFRPSRGTTEHVVQGGVRLQDRQETESHTNSQDNPD
jgi:hypothetical protein